ncbi:hypothetical protein T07_3696 [Trichinella nelsoni]|uniref:Uncharacterized protein n=1 Tax=Trichinella nelsoni TaxID=6336 RepID=A0A0V0S0E7_9BILA|nr:hypothetical protein T07_3696 [Trichinella nelsoni]
MERHHGKFNQYATASVGTFIVFCYNEKLPCVITNNTLEPVGKAFTAATEPQFSYVDIYCYQKQNTRILRDILQRHSGTARKRHEFQVNTGWQQYRLHEKTHTSSTEERHRVNSKSHQKKRRTCLMEQIQYLTMFVMPSLERIHVILTYDSAQSKRNTKKDEQQVVRSIPQPSSLKLTQQRRTDHTIDFMTVQQLSPLCQRLA